MKKLLVMLLVSVMSFSFVACGEKVTSNNDELQINKSVLQQEETNQQTAKVSETETDEVTEDTIDEVPDEATDEAITAVLEAEYLTGVWVWKEDMSPNSITQMRSFELYEDGTGKILSFSDEKLLSTSLTWVIEPHGSWSSVHLFSDISVWNCNYELNGNYLMDLTGSDFFAKETK